MTKELAIKILSGDVLGTSEQTHEAIKIAIKGLEAEPIRHGRWLVDAEDFRHQIEWYECSQCRFESSTAYNYCPHCGARMEGAEE